MDYNVKVFWKYVWHEHLHIKNWASSSVFYEYLMMFTTLYIVIFTNISLQKKAIIFMGFLVGISVLKFYALYKSGAHRGWNREKYGMFSKSQLKKYKSEKKKGEKIPLKIREKGIR